jgi:hypothetical protein
MARAGLVTTRRGGTRIFYALASDRVADLWSALTQVAAEHVAGLRQLAEAYLGSREGIEVIGRDELAARLARGEVLVLDVRPVAEYAAGHITGARSVPVTEMRLHLRAARRRRRRRLLPGSLLRVCRRGGARAEPPRVPGMATGRRFPRVEARRPAGSHGGRRRGEPGMAGTLIVPIVDEGLGNSAYLIDLGDGRALAVDVPRHLRAVRAADRRHRLTAAFAADTHLHADFLSGALQLAAEDGAQILASAAGCRAFAHRGLADGDEVDLGGLTLRAWATPAIPLSTLPTCCSMGRRCWGCSPVGRCWWARLPAPTCPGRSTPSRWPAPSTPRWAGCSRCPMQLQEPQLVELAWRHDCSGRTDDCLLSPRELLRMRTFWAPTRRSEGGGPVPGRPHPRPSARLRLHDGYAPDGHSLVGPLPATPDVWILGGFSGHGFQLVPAIGEIAAYLIRYGRTSLPIAPSTPAATSTRVPPQAGSWRARHGAPYSSWRRHHMPVSLRPSGARSSHGYMPHTASSPRSYAE